MIDCYQDASEYLGKKTDRPLSGRSTRIVRNADDSISVRYHDTNVVTYTRGNDSRIVLNSGGFKSSTTKARINEYTPFTLAQRKGQWTLYTIQSVGYPFADGMSIDPVALTVDGANDNPDADLVLRKSINKYSADYIAALFAMNVPAPSAGDCWACKGIVDDGLHISEHMRESYYVPQMIVNAIADFPVSRYAKDTLYHLWQQDYAFDRLEDLAHKQLLKSLRKYLYRQFGLVA